MKNLLEYMHTLTIDVPDALFGNFMSREKLYLEHVKKFYPDNGVIVLKGQSSDLSNISNDAYESMRPYREEFHKKRTELNLISE